MVVNVNTSFLLSLTFCILIFSGLQMYKGLLGSSRFLTLLGGYAASWLFVLLLTAVNNFEVMMFGKGFQARVLPEVVSCLFISCVAAAMVHRVSVTVCVLCSMVALYYLNKQSGQSFVSNLPSRPSQVQQTKKRK